MLTQDYGYVDDDDVWLLSGEGLVGSSPNCCMGDPADVLLSECRCDRTLWRTDG